jgi:DNA-damage-inducible protein J
LTIGFQPRAAARRANLRSSKVAILRHCRYDAWISLTNSQLRHIIQPNLGAITVAAQTSMLHIRVDDDIKEQATLTLTAMGMSVSDAVRLFLRRVVIDQAFPLELKVPNAETLAAMEESRAMMAKRRARFASADELFADLEKNSSK